jgi:hypothetical protein
MPRPAPVMTAIWPASGGLDVVSIKAFSFQKTLFYFASMVLCLHCASIVHRRDRLKEPKKGGACPHLS